jgi:uroporphyrin-III C-methyltransferase/precorrin-2 dehydrogenase/sirohydrochlorin ferrochelatase
VLIVDRLVDPSLLVHAKEGSRTFFVGKEGGNPNSTSQDAINQLMVTEARHGQLVLRLKGGDVSFFSNIMGELEALSENNIEYEIVPGVTAASGAAACAGIPLTARGFSASVRFLSYTRVDSIDEHIIQDLASTEDTLVFYMAAQSLPSLIKRLSAHHIDAEKWVAVVEQATTPYQKVFAHPLYDFMKAIQERKFKSPSLVIIGKVVKLSQKFQWMEETPEEREFFRPITENISKSLQYA